MSNLLRHPFHLVDESPWPLLASFSGLGLTSGLLKWFHENSIDRVTELGYLPAHHCMPLLSRFPCKWTSKLFEFASLQLFCTYVCPYTRGRQIEQALRKVAIHPASVMEQLFCNFPLKIWIGGHIQICSCVLCNFCHFRRLLLPISAWWKKFVCHLVSKYLNRSKYTELSLPFVRFFLCLNPVFASCLKPGCIWRQSRKNILEWSEHASLK